MVAAVWEVEVTDRGRAVVKHTTSYDARLEAEGLEALRVAGAPVPEVWAVAADVIVLEHVSGTPAWAELGGALARVHRTTDDRFGWDRDNVLGPLHQDNTRSSDWPSFFVERRVRPHLHAEALPVGVRRRLADACDGPLPDLLDHDPVPSLIHGDLWHGNVVDGRWLIDPAVHHADRELELAFMAQFGGFPDELWHTYLDAWPLAHGWQRRRPALQLYHLLVHVELFGASYVAPVVDRLDRLGW